MTPETTASCTRAACSTSTATADTSCGWTQRRPSRAPRRSRPPCRTPTLWPEPGVILHYQGDALRRGYFGPRVGRDRPTASLQRRTVLRRGREESRAFDVARRR